MSARVTGLGTAIIALIGLSCLFVWIDVQGFRGQDLEFLGAKALVARYAPDPRMQVIGFVFSPVLVYGTLILDSPVALQVLLAALAVLASACEREPARVQGTVHHTCIPAPAARRIFRKLR